MMFSTRLKVLLICFFVGGFHSLHAQKTLPVKPFSDGVSKDILYAANLRYRDFTFSGFFAVKSESEGYHIYLISKTGFTLIEVILKENKSVWIKTLPFLEKDSRKQKLDNDFRLLCQSPLRFSSMKKETKKGIKVKFPDGEHAKYFVKNGTVTAAKTVGFLHLIRTKISFTHTDSIGLPQSIIMTKSLIGAEINLKINEH